MGRLSDTKKAPQREERRRGIPSRIGGVVGRGLDYLTRPQRAVETIIGRRTGATQERARDVLSGRSRGITGRELIEPRIPRQVENVLTRGPGLQSGALAATGLALD